MNGVTLACFCLLLRLRLLALTYSLQRHHLWQLPAAARHGDKVRPRTRTASRCVVFTLAAHHLPTPGRAAPHTNVSACLSSALFPAGALKTLARLRRRLRFPQVFTDASVSSAPRSAIHCRFLDAIISQ